VNQKLSHEAVEWFVLNESGSAEDPELAQRWEQWCVEPGNRMEYVSLLQLAQDLRTLPPPSEASRKELVEDVGEEEPGTSRTV